MSFSWFVVSYSGPTSVTFTAAGQTSLAELAEQLKDDLVQVCIFLLFLSLVSVVWFCGFSSLALDTLRARTLT